jgi:hypothetical protein
MKASGGGVEVEVEAELFFAVSFVLRAEGLFQDVIMHGHRCQGSGGKIT